jgi:hypothetical protein
MGGHKSEAEALYFRTYERRACKCRYWCTSTGSCDYAIINKKCRTVVEGADGVKRCDPAINDSCPFRKSGRRRVEPSMLLFKGSLQHGQK